MKASLFIDYSYQALIIVAWLSLPTVLTAAVVGLVFGLLQAVTQIQDNSVGQAAKLLACVVVLVLTVRWMGHELVVFASDLFKNFPAIVR